VWTSELERESRERVPSEDGRGSFTGWRNSGSDWAAIGRRGRDGCAESEAGGAEDGGGADSGIGGAGEGPSVMAKAVFGKEWDSGYKRSLDSK
jgi:hypothetical protein